MSVFSNFLDISFVLMVIFGALAGFFVGAIPGLSVSMATALLVSISFGWKPNLAFAMIMGVYVVGVYSGAVSAILINIPGAPSSLVTMLDGYPLAKMGRADEAIKIAGLYSFIGSIFGFVLLYFLSGQISRLALKFHPIDYFLLALLGLVSASGLGGGGFIKGFTVALLGVIFSLVGMDSVYGVARLSSFADVFQGGIPLIPALIGLFGFSELLFNLFNPNGAEFSGKIKKCNTSVVFRQLKHFPSSILYSLIGAVVGALPGAGGPVASILAYECAKRIVKKPEQGFGKGSVEGLIASESANNACVGGAMIPMLCLAVPGDSVTAIMLSVFYIHGMNPGPNFLLRQGELFNSIVAAGLIASFMILFIAFVIAPKMQWLMKIKKERMLIFVGFVCLVGAYANSTRVFDVGVMLFFGVLGFFMKKFKFPLPPLSLGLVLGSMMDSQFRRFISLGRAGSEYYIKSLSSPISIVLIFLIVLSLARSTFFKTKLTRQT